MMNVFEVCQLFLDLVLFSCQCCPMGTGTTGMSKTYKLFSIKKNNNTQSQHIWRFAAIAWLHMTQIMNVRQCRNVFEKSEKSLFILSLEKNCQYDEIEELLVDTVFCFQFIFCFFFHPRFSSIQTINVKNIL